MATWTGTLTEEREPKKTKPYSTKPGRSRFKRFKIVPTSGEQFHGEVFVNKDTLGSYTISAITLTYS